MLIKLCAYFKYHENLTELKLPTNTEIVDIP